MISVAEALQRISASVRPLPHQRTPLEDLVGRYLQQDVPADVDSPPHDKSMMDGFAVRSTDVRAGVELDVLETVIAGAEPQLELGPGQATRIMTGAPLPPGADAIVMVEQARVSRHDGAERVSFEIDSVAPEKHVLRRGANFGAGQILFPQGHRIRPTDVGLLAEVGLAFAEVPRLPRVAVLATGDELVDCGQQPGAAQIRNSNGPLLTALSRQGRLPVDDLGIGRDDPESLFQAIGRGLEADILLLSGGVSAGTHDLVPGLLSEHGVQEIFHKVAVKPGKPIWFGTRDDADRQTVVFGLPGNPLSTMIGFRLFVVAAVRRMLGGPLPCEAAWRAELAVEHQTRGNRPTYWPGVWEPAEDARVRVRPLRWNGSSDLWALGQANGLIHFPADRQQHAAGDLVEFLPLGE